jgi:inactivated superfamily I helicase
MVGDVVRIDVYGDVQVAGRIAAFVSPDQARRLATELARVAAAVPPAGS